MLALGYPALHFSQLYGSFSDLTPHEKEQQSKASKDALV
jgi:hypothetical protein